MRRFLMITTVLLGTALLGCEDGMSPQARSDTSNLRQAPGAPPLQTYTVQFTAVKGEAKEVEVKYAPPGGEAEDFLDIEIPEDGLLRRPDGTLIQNGESVDFTVTIDPQEFVFTFEPAGVQFDPAFPMRIEVRYENADPDFDGDGDTDEDDETIRLQAIGFFREDEPALWTPLPTTHDTVDRILTSRSKVLENIAVSW